ncbi:Lrp/AsnC family transcriptional regulator [Albirhodobacter sp. R86504]|jgi:Lrp/AsnC family leucine-responsive transcriptional regulator|uniref:Lrp/AsnC family transcriptional regulator n=1 Tax=Albirhodobacter sp. R86504 TaxID=3093848 RepID=UPI003672A91D
MTYTLDQIDYKIIDQLTSDARQPVAEIARRVGLSKTPVAARIKYLEEIGLITGYRAVLNPMKMGLSHVAYVEVRVTDTRQAALEKFNAAVKLVPEIEECYMIAGGFDYLLKVRSRDIAEYRKIMGEKISALPYVNATATYVAMEAVIEQGAFAIS